MSQPGASTVRRVPLRPANSFDLIRLLAYSQHDSRKAVAELVQNSLDAGAESIIIIRHRRANQTALTIFDNGNGVLPELDRAEALTQIASQIGCSLKRNLSASQRRQQMMQGTYGIGLLGFWCIGQQLEMRSRVDGSDAWVLRLLRDDPTAEVHRIAVPRPLIDDTTWTEVAIHALHPTPARVLSGRRLQHYLGSELRGQLLGRDVCLRIIDRLTRNVADRDLMVAPARFQGQPLEHLASLAVGCYASARVELFYNQEPASKGGRVALASGGTVVCDDITSSFDILDHRLWSSGQLEGVIDFPDLVVAPGTRRGVVPGPEADALLLALTALEPVLRDQLLAQNEQRAVEQDQDLGREIRKIFAALPKSLVAGELAPPASQPQTSTQSDPNVEQQPAKAATQTSSPPEPAPQVESIVLDEGKVELPPSELFPPGPLHRVIITPRRCQLLVGGTRGFMAQALDERGHPIATPPQFRWQVSNPAVTLLCRDDRAQLNAGQEAGTIELTVTADDGHHPCQAEASIQIVERLSTEEPPAPIPDPQRVMDPGATWRSRWMGTCWQYNAAHPDYQAVVDAPRLRLRYLLHLLAKEMVLRHHGQPADEPLLERMVEMLTHISLRS